MSTQHRTSQEKDTIDQLLNDITLFTKSLPSEKLRCLLAEVLKIQNEGSSHKLVVTSAHISESCKRKSKNKSQDICYRLSIIIMSFFMVILLGQQLLSPAALAVFGSDDANYIVVRILESPLMQYMLPQDLQENVGTQSQTSYFMMLYWLRLMFVSSGYFHLFGERNVTKGQCFVSNPLQAVFGPTGPPVNCEICSEVHRILSVKSSVSKELLTKGALYSYPLLLRKQGMNVTLLQIQDQVAQFSSILALHHEHMWFSSNVDYISEVHDLASRDVISRLDNDSSVQLIWTSYNYKTSHIFRKFIKRPSPIEQDIWKGMSRVRSVMINGRYSLPQNLTVNRQSQSTVAYYSQGLGSRILFLTPKDDCSSFCQTLTTQLQPSDILVFNDQVWDTFTVPSGNSTSITFISQIVL